MDDRAWMKLAIQEARKIGWKAHPNPMVGAIIVKDGQEIGRGCHHGAGTPHAEVEAILNAKQRGFNDISNATIYVTLEPCNHFGRTPPCTQALIREKISRCVIGTVDPDARMRGSGIRRLINAGIQCEVGVCAQELIQLNAAFFTRTALNRPYITAKWAMTADGATATKSGNSKWITSQPARDDVHIQRALHDAIIAGTQTILCDNPTLNVRLPTPSKQPIRIILDARLKIPPSANVFNTQNQKTILFTAQTDLPKFYASRNIDVHTIPTQNGFLNLTQILNILADQYQITTLYCEGGATLHGSLNDIGAIDQIHIYIAPKLVGSTLAKHCVGGNGVDIMENAAQFSFSQIQAIGPDVKLSATINRLPNTDAFLKF